MFLEHLLNIYIRLMMMKQQQPEPKSETLL